MSQASDALVPDLGMLLEQAIAKAATRGKPYFVVTISDDPDDGEAGIVVKQCANAGEAAERLSAMVGRKVFGLVFVGERCMTTGYPYHLITPDGTFPLIAPASNLDVDPSGFLGIPVASLALAAEVDGTGIAGTADVSAIVGSDDDDDDEEEDDEEEEEEEEEDDE